MEEIQSQVVNIANGLSTLSLVRLPDELFFPRHLLHLFQEIDKTIPEPWNFVIPTHPDNVWLLNQNIKVVTATAINYKSHKSLKLFLHIPIYEKTFVSIRTTSSIYLQFTNSINLLNANASHGL